MAFIKSASPENIKGELFVMGKDQDTGKEVRFRIRATPDAVARKIAESRGRVREVQRAVEEKDGKKMFLGLVKTRVYEPDDMRQANRDEAIYDWTGSENFSIRALDEGMAKVYAGLLGTESIEVGIDIPVDDRLTEELKRYLLDNDASLAEDILEKAMELGKRERDLRGNS